MRIGLVVERFDPLRGGLEQWTYRFAERLLARRHEVHVISRQFTERTLGMGVVPHKVRCGHSPMSFAAAAQTTLERMPLDVIHDMGAGWYCDVFQPHGGSWASVNHRKLEFSAPWFRCLKAQVNPWLPRQREFQRLMARQYADHGQTMLALSRGVAADFQRFHQVAGERIRIVYNGVDTEHYAPARCRQWRDIVRRQLNVAPGELLALVVAQNFQLKGVPTLLRAVARLAAAGRPVKLAVVGGRRLGAWQRWTRRLGAADCVHFVGSVDDPLPYYAAADVYVHPTLYDTCSLVVLEAAACGLPIITTCFNGAAELLQNGHDSLVMADPTDHKKLAGHIETMLDAAFRHDMGAAARQTALRNTFERNVEQILAIYREIVERRQQLASDYAILTGRVSAETPIAPRRTVRAPAADLGATGVCS